MTYSCSDFTDDIIDALEVTKETDGSPSDQADICLAEIRRLQAVEKAALAKPPEETVLIMRADENVPLFKVQLQQYVEKTATAVVEAPTFKEARDKAYEIAHTLTWTDGDDSYGVEAYTVLDANDEIVWER